VTAFIMQLQLLPAQRIVALARQTRSLDTGGGFQVPEFQLPPYDTETCCAEYVLFPVAVFASVSGTAVRRADGLIAQAHGSRRERPGVKEAHPRRVGRRLEERSSFPEEPCVVPVGAIRGGGEDDFGEGVNEAGNLAFGSGPVRTVKPSIPPSSRQTEHP
jgi:hypothetical protein